MEFVKTKRGARALLHEGYRYVINRRGRDERIFWRCSKSRTCSGSLCTLDDQIISSRKDQHNHPPDEAETVVEEVIYADDTDLSSDLRMLEAWLLLHFCLNRQATA